MKFSFDIGFNLNLNMFSVTQNIMTYNSNLQIKILSIFYSIDFMLAHLVPIVKCAPLSLDVSTCVYR